MTRPGYSAYKPKQAASHWVTWTDRHGRRVTKKGFRDEDQANIFGRARAHEADLGRLGVMSDKQETFKAMSSIPVVSFDNRTCHLDLWEEHLGGGSHARVQVKRVERLLSPFIWLSEISPDSVSVNLRQLAGRTSPQTAKHYLSALKAFIKWCLKTDRLLDDPIKAVVAPKCAGKVFTRKPLDAEDVCRLCESTKGDFANETGWGRAVFYMVLAHTGLRVSEAMSLTPESFDFGGCSITVEAAYSKRRRRDVIPITQGLSQGLRTWVGSNRPPNIRVFHFKKGARLNEQFKRDCAAAGITAAPGERLGMHSLRRFYITSVGRTGGLRVAQELARHSNPKLTSDYMDPNMADIEKGLAGLPPVEGDKQQKRMA